jgi:hypothetical protein
MVNLKTCTAIGKPLKYVKISEKRMYECGKCKGCAYNMLIGFRSEEEAKQIGMAPLRNRFNNKIKRHR